MWYNPLKLPQIILSGVDGERGEEEASGVVTRYREGVISSHYVATTSSIRCHATEYDDDNNKNNCTNGIDGTTRTVDGLAGVSLLFL